MRSTRGTLTTSNDSKAKCLPSRAKFSVWSLPTTTVTRVKRKP